MAAAVKAHRSQAFVRMMKQYHRWPRESAVVEGALDPRGAARRSSARCSPPAALKHGGTTLGGSLQEQVYGGVDDGAELHTASPPRALRFAKQVIELDSERLADEGREPLPQDEPQNLREQIEIQIASQLALLLRTLEVRSHLVTPQRTRLSMDRS